MTKLAAPAAYKTKQSSAMLNDYQWAVAHSRAQTRPPVWRVVLVTPVLLAMLVVVALTLALDWCLNHLYGDQS